MNDSPPGGRPWVERPCRQASVSERAGQITLAGAGRSDVEHVVDRSLVLRLARPAARLQLLADPCPVRKCLWPDTERGGRA